MNRSQSLSQLVETHTVTTTIQTEQTPPNETFIEECAVQFAHLFQDFVRRNLSVEPSEKEIGTFVQIIGLAMNKMIDNANTTIIVSSREQSVVSTTHAAMSIVEAAVAIYKQGVQQSNGEKEKGVPSLED